MRIGWRDGREDPRAGRRREARPRPAGRASADRRGRGQLRRRSQVPDLRRRPRERRRSCGPTEGRNAASLQAFFDGLTTSRRPRSRRSRSTCPPAMRKRSAPTRASRTPRSCFDPFHVVQLGGKAADQVRRDEYNQHGRSATGDGQVDQGHALQPAQGPRQADRQAAAQARRGRAHQQARCTARSCSTASCATSTSVPKHEARRAPRRVARVGIPLPAETVRQARPHDPQAQARRARRDRARARATSAFHTAPPGEVVVVMPSAAGLG